MRKSLLLSLLFLAVSTIPVSAQYFGRNKPRYQKQKFQVTDTRHFEIYDYLNNPEKLQELADAAEVWYGMHKEVFQSDLDLHNPLIIYNDHAGFQQTNTISGDISVGTGGVTEGLRNRVIFPVAMTNQQTHHVLGHELVHAFQYRMVIGGDSTSIQNLGNIPLWMIEGLAEYLSIGRIDPHTALWMRDGVMSDQLPRIKDLDSGKFFPYRWGQAFWAYVTGMYGDEVIRPLYMNTAKYGLKASVPMTLGITVDSLSDNWRSALSSHYGVWVKKGQKENPPGKTLLDDDKAGKMNICPVLSPNGRYVVFLSEKNVFTTDLFMADAKTGKIIKRVASTAKDGHIDQFNFIESAGTWSPDSKLFAFDVYEKGQSVLVIRNLFGKKGVKKTRKVSLKGVPAFSNPTWSPDGKTIVVSGLVNGQTDLYAYDVKSGKVTRLTNDRYAEILPAWSPDGRFLAFSTDEVSIQRGRINGAWHMNLAVMDMSNNKVEHLDVFPGADNMNPQFDKAGNLFFVSDRDGFRNMYRYEMASKNVFQMTKLMTGVTGITPYAPSFTVSEDRDRILFTHYSKGEYSIHQARLEDFISEKVDASAVDMVAASLPPFRPGAKDIVNRNLRLMDGTTTAVADSTTLKTKPFKPKFTLNYAGGSTGVGVMTGNRSFGNTAGGVGGVDLLFGDILGDHQLYIGAAINGEIQDAAFQASYINRKNPIGWGVGVGHIPFITGGGYLPFGDATDVVQFEKPISGYQFGVADTFVLRRQFLQQINGFVFYPFSVTKRVELGGSLELFSVRETNYVDYYGLNNNGTITNFPLTNERVRGDGFGPIDIYSVNAAFVGDNSYFGFTSPLKGWRYRLSAEQYFGYWQYTGLLADGRQYFYKKPFTLALRGMAYGRFGGNVDLVEGGQYRVQPLFVIQPWFVRGYPYNFLINDNPQLIEASAGSKMGVANAEIRLPFMGPRGIAVIPSRFLPVDLNVFFDAGFAWFNQDDFKEDPDNPDQIVHKPLYSTGVSARINLFGYLVIEPYFALPLSAPSETRRWLWGLNFAPGW